MVSNALSMKLSNIASALFSPDPGIPLAKGTASVLPLALSLSLP